MTPAPSTPQPRSGPLLPAVSTTAEASNADLLAVPDPSAIEPGSISDATASASPAISVPPPSCSGSGNVRRTSPLAKLLINASPTFTATSKPVRSTETSLPSVIDPALLSPAAVASGASTPISPSAAAYAYPSWRRERDLGASPADPIPLVPVPIPSSQISGLAKYPLKLQTTLDHHRLSRSAYPSTTSTKSAGSFPGLQSLPLSLASSPLTTPSDGQSGLDSALTSPAVATSEGSLYDDQGEGDADERADTEEHKDGSGVPVPKQKVKKSHARKQPEGHIKRARNAFILFRKHITDSNLIPPTVEVKHQNISVVAAKMWREAPHDVRAKFQEMARIEKEEHNRKYPNYRYQPVFRRTDIIRRRVRKDGAEDEKVDAVAAALIHGKAGAELEKEIQEQELVDPNADISPENSAARSRSRRRRDPGVPSKGAIRAQKTRQRQNQMRSSLLGHNLLNISLYNAAQQQAQQQQRAEAAAAALAEERAHALAHAHARTHGYYGGAEPYGADAHYLHRSHPVPEQGYEAGHHREPSLPHGAYEPYAHSDPYGYSHGYAQQHYPPTSSSYQVHDHAPADTGPYAHAYPEEMYRLPPLLGYNDPEHRDGPGPGSSSVFPAMPHRHGVEHPFDGVHSTRHPQPHGGNGDIAAYNFDRQYRLPPLLNQSHLETNSLFPEHTAATREQNDTGITPPDAGVSERTPGSTYSVAKVRGSASDTLPSMWAGEQHAHNPAAQTPSGHVQFDAQLFDGALRLPGVKADEDGLGDFDDAVRQANEMW